MDSFKYVMAMLWLAFMMNNCQGLKGDKNRKISCPPCERTKKKVRSGVKKWIVDCSNRNITEVPECDWRSVRTLKLGHNKIKTITGETLYELRNLRILDLGGNSLESIGKPNISMKLRKLNLEGNNFDEIPRSALSMMPNLIELKMAFNYKLKYLRENDFGSQRKLVKLDLSATKLENISFESIKKLKKLKTLKLGYSNLVEIPDLAFEGLNELRLLELDRSTHSEDGTTYRIKRIEPQAFSFLPKLRRLSVMYAGLKTFPNLTGTNSLKEIILNDNEIQSMPDNFCENKRQLEEIDLTHNKLERIPKLTDCRNLLMVKMDNNRIRQIEDSFRGLGKLLDITLKHNEIERIGENDFGELKNLEMLFLEENKITNIHDNAFSSFENIKRIDMKHNRIQRLGNSFRGLKRLLKLTLDANEIESIGENDFKGLESLETLILNDNKITSIHENAFSSFRRLEWISLENNNFPILPTKGLQTVTHLSIKGNTKLTKFPSPRYFSHLKTLEVEYPYHCCYYLRKVSSKRKTENPEPRVKMEFRWLSSESDNNSHDLQLNPSDFGNFTGIHDDTSNETTSHEVRHDPEPPSYNVTCTPKPDPFFPCEDLMGDWVLRFGVWIVFLLALTGNATVIVVIMASQTKIDVSRFLISNLAFADLFMGIYLGFLAIVDVTTLGDFKKHALDWQLSAGCQTAGFLAVLSSELSVFTLTVITLERYIAIKNAIRINRKLELKTAMIVMAIGWLFAIATASLPLVQISSYGKFSVCLPFEIENTPSIVFLTVLLCLNATAFVIILSCYILMYCSIRGSNAWNASDFRVAKRMALLVITDFACWAPIVFLSLTAAFGTSLVSLQHAKIITVFVFPLNSCANPFLYAILTSHFKSDLLAMCRRVEDKYPFLKVTKQKISFSRRSSYSGAISENANFYLRIRRHSLPVLPRNSLSITSHDKGGSSASSKSNNKSLESNALVSQNENVERETYV